MLDRIGKPSDSARGLRTLAIVNLAMWTLAMVALVFVIQRDPGARGMFVILVSGCGVAISLLSRVGGRPPGRDGSVSSGADRSP